MIYKSRSEYPLFINYIIVLNNQTNKSGYLSNDNGIKFVYKDKWYLLASAGTQIADVSLPPEELVAFSNNKYYVKHLFYNSLSTITKKMYIDAVLFKPSIVKYIPTKYNIQTFWDACATTNIKILLYYSYINFPLIPSIEHDNNNNNKDKDHDNNKDKNHDNNKDKNHDNNKDKNHDNNKDKNHDNNKDKNHDKSSKLCDITEICDKCIDNSQWSLRLLPYNYRTLYYCKLSVQKNINDLQYVPPNINVSDLFT